MDPPEFTSGRSPRRELQGPRPTPLRVRKDSHKIRKPPVAPPPAAVAPQTNHAPPRPPVIIYTLSPKVIHANPNEFMSLVQRLTGPSPGAPSTSYNYPDTGNGSISPAARFASIERTRSPKPGPAPYDQNLGFPDVIELLPDVHRTGQFHGILSPNPTSLPPIPAKFFSPAAEGGSNPLSYFPDLSPIIPGGRNYAEGSGFLLPSPPAFFSPVINMPSPNTLDLFHSLFDL